MKKAVPRFMKTWGAAFSLINGRGLPGELISETSLH